MKNWLLVYMNTQAGIFSQKKPNLLALKVSQKFEGLNEVSTSIFMTILRLFSWTKKTTFLVFTIFSVSSIENSNLFGKN